MSHTLHRSGSARSLSGDWVVLAMTAGGINRDGSAPRLRRFLELAGRHSPVNLGDIRTGSVRSQGLARLLESVTDGSVPHAVFDSRRRLTAFLKALRAEDLGISIVVSGLLDSGRRAFRKAGLRPHSVAVSLGVWGRTEDLPELPTLDIVSMCGHGMVPCRLVEEMAAKAASGELTAREAALRLAQPCVCGIFNPRRAERLLPRIVRLRRRPASSR